MVVKNRSHTNILGCASSFFERQGVKSPQWGSIK